MTTAECIRQRVSCRRFQETPFPGGHPPGGGPGPVFPSWKNTQPVRYVVVDDPVLKERIARSASPARASTPRPSTGPPLWRWSPIPACPARETPPDGGPGCRMGEMFDAGIAAQTFCLAARELDIGTCILGIFRRGRRRASAEAGGQRAACLIAMGYPEQWKNGPGRKGDGGAAVLPVRHRQGAIFMTDHGQLGSGPPDRGLFPGAAEAGGPAAAGPGGLPPGGGGRRCQRRSADGRQLSLWRQRGWKRTLKRRFTGFSQTAEDDPAGLYWQALCYDNGLGVDQDEDRACRLYQESAAHGYAPALCNLGVCYESGQGVERTRPRPWSCIARRRTRATPWAGATWASCTFFGQGVEKDQKKAAYCFAQAAEQRLPGPSTCWACAAESVTAWSGTYPGLWPCTGRRRTPDIPTPSAPWGAVPSGQGVAQDHGRQPACSVRRRRGLSPGLALPGTEL